MNLLKKHKTISEVLPGFLNEKRITNQVKSYKTCVSHINTFIKWLESKNLKNACIIKIDNQIIKEFFCYLADDKGLDKTTCQKYYINIRLLFKYAKKNKEIYEVPFDDIIFPKKKEDKSAGLIAHKDLKLLLTTIQEEDQQLYLACLLEYYCFIRPGRELRHLKISDINLEEGYITVRKEISKNGKKQTVTIPNQLIDIFKNLNIENQKEDLFIFGCKKKFGYKPVSVNMLRWRFNKIRDKLGLSNKYKLYSFKHTGASNLHQSGIPMRELMDQLRHSKLEATQHYLKTHCGLVNERIKESFPNPY